jgi:hypothetical protein
MMSIQERACPLCHVNRTFRLWRGSLCANCKHQFQFDAPSANARRTPISHSRVSALHLGPDAIARLNAYRAAVAHGLYTDYPL